MSSHRTSRWALAAAPLLLLLVPACRSPASAADPSANAHLAERLSAFANDPSKAHRDACLDALRSAQLHIAVRRPDAGDDAQVAMVDDRRGRVLFAFIEKADAVAWWKNVGTVTTEAVAGPPLIEVAALHHADLLVLEPQAPGLTFVIPGDELQATAKAWGTKTPR